MEGKVEEEVEGDGEGEGGRTQKGGWGGEGERGREKRTETIKPQGMKYKSDIIHRNSLKACPYNYVGE